MEGGDAGGELGGGGWMVGCLFRRQSGLAVSRVEPACTGVASQVDYLLSLFRFDGEGAAIGYASSISCLL